MQLSSSAPWRGRKAAGQLVLALLVSLLLHSVIARWSLVTDPHSPGMVPLVLDVRLELPPGAELALARARGTGGPPAGARESSRTITVAAQPVGSARAAMDPAAGNRAATVLPETAQVGEQADAGAHPAPGNQAPEPIYLTPEALHRAARGVSGVRLADDVRAQLGVENTGPSARLADAISAAALPPCLPSAEPDQEGGGRVAFGGLLALPSLVYAVVAGTCR